MFWIDPLFLLIVSPGLILAAVATWKTKSTFKKYSRIAAASGLTGGEAARRMLDAEGVGGVQIERVQGFLSDHYDPSKKTLRLSPNVYSSRSLAAVGVACHEAGHAIQHARAYAPLGLRTALVPATQFASSAAYPLFFVGLFLSWTTLIHVGVILFACSVLFALVTLPVEWDATARAKRVLVRDGIVAPGEAAGAASVLNAAFLTYVASAVTSLLTLLYFLMRAGLLGGDD
jgi:uncharacterized protein